MMDTISLLAEIKILEERLRESEPKQSKWIDDGDTLICDNCRTAYNRPLFHNGWNYCPNCGARMKGADDETD